jgi:RNA polymerase sigma factor (sigma-70 family)
MRSSDEQAFADAVARHRPELERHCARLLRSGSDAEDAVQDALLRAWRSRRTLASSSPRAWLYRIATNACLDLLARRPLPPAALDEERAAPPEERPDAKVLARETVELALLTAIQELPARQHACFVMRDVLRWSAGESADALATSVPAANSALQRARRGLRARLAPDPHQWHCAPPSRTERRVVRCYLSALGEAA